MSRSPQTIEGQFRIISVKIHLPVPPAPLDHKLATYARDGLITYPASCFKGSRLATQA